jgi:hypothetical protein
VIGCGGAREQVEVPVSPRELVALQNSAKVLKDILAQVRARLAGKPVSAAPPAQPAASPAQPAAAERSVPRQAWTGR